MTTPRILLVEDDPEQAMLFAQVLSTYQYHVETVATAEEAMSLLKSSPYSLVLADWDLPGDMQGDALIVLVKQHTPQMKTVLFSNHSHVDQAAASSGADAWLRKFDGITKLRGIINKLAPIPSKN